jgi:hypothetical protein
MIKPRFFIREALINSIWPSLRAQRSNPAYRSSGHFWIAASLRASQ